MVRLFFIWALVAFPAIAVAQAFGGQITRPVKRQQNTQQTDPKSSNNNNKQRVTREITFESTLSEEERRKWNKEKAKAKEVMRQLAYNLKSQKIEPRGNFYDGLAACNIGYIDKKGNLVIRTGNYWNYNFHNGYALIEKDRKWGVIDNNGIFSGLSAD